MKKIYIVFAAVALIQILSSVSYCYDDYLDDSIGNILDSVSDDTLELLRESGLDEFSAEELYNVTISDIADLLLSIFKGSFNLPFKVAVTVMGISLIAAIGQNCIGKSKSVSLILETVSLVFVTLVIYSSVSGLVNRAVTSVLSAGALMKLLVPILAGIVAFSGNPALAVSYNAVTLYTAEIISAVCRDFVTPVIMIFIALSGSLAFNSLIKADVITNIIKRLVNTILGFSGTIFTGVITVKDVLASGADKLSVKGMKFLIGTSVPVVGSALSDGLSSVIASVALMKNTLGIIGIILIIVIVLPVVCELMLWILSIYLCEYFCSVLSQQKHTALLSSLRFSFSMMLSLILFTVYILIVSTGLVILMGSR